jgi:hypothetical protein
MKNNRLTCLNHAVFPLWMLALLLLPACSSESRDRLWQTLDPAGYKHAHSEVFNPKKYKREAPRESSHDLGEMDITR